jgi:hypothetical protein
VAVADAATGALVAGGVSVAAEALAAPPAG